jgi:GAF domain-containing protein
MTARLKREHQDYALRLMQIASSIAAKLDLDPLLQEIVDAATDLIGAEFGGILVLDQDDPVRYELLRVHGWQTPSNLPQPQGARHPQPAPQGRPAIAPGQGGAPSCQRGRPGWTPSHWPFPGCAPALPRSRAGQPLLGAASRAPLLHRTRRSAPHRPDQPGFRSHRERAPAPANRAVRPHAGARTPDP